VEGGREIKRDSAIQKERQKERDRKKERKREREKERKIKREKEKERDFQRQTPRVCLLRFQMLNCFDARYNDNDIVLVLTSKEF